MGSGVVRVRAQDSREEVVESLGGAETDVPVIPWAHPDAGAGNDEPADAVGTPAGCRPGFAEALLEPEGNASLVAHLVDDAEIGKEVVGPSNHGILGFPRRVGIPVEDVVVPDASP